MLIVGIICIFLAYREAVLMGHNGLLLTGVTNMIGAVIFYGLGKSKNGKAKDGIEKAQRIIDALERGPSRLTGLPKGYEPVLEGSGAPPPPDSRSL